MCGQRSCWQRGLRKDTLGHALKTAIGPADRSALEEFAASLPGEPAVVEAAALEGV